MKKLINFIVLGLFFFVCNAQFTLVKQWDKRFGGNSNDNFNEFQQTNDGGYVLAGHTDTEIFGDITEAGRGSFDCWLVKIDSMGNKEWDKRYGGTGYEAPHSLLQTVDNGYLIGMISSSGLNGDKTEPNWGSWDFWIVKTDGYGGKQWDKRFGGTDGDYLQSAIQTQDGGYLLGGSSSSGVSGDKTEASRGDCDFWIVKIDSMGNKQWDKRYGGTKCDGIGDLAITNDGGYFLGGGSHSDSSGDKSQNTWGSGANFRNDFWVVRIDSVGNKEWDKDYGGTKDDDFYSLQKTIDGGYVLGGLSASGIGGDKTNDRIGYWIVKIDSTGNKEWDKGYSGGIHNFNKIRLTTDGGYLLSGRSTVDVPGDDKTENNFGIWQTWIVKTDSAGDKQWDKTIFTKEVNDGYAIQTSDGCYAVAAICNGGIGGYKSQPNWDGGVDSTYDYWIMKFCMDTVTGIDDRQQTQDTRQMQVWPNPFSSDLSLTLSEGEGRAMREATFTITNMLGQVVYRREENNLATGYTKVLDLSWLANGVYFVEVASPPTPLLKERGEVWRVVRKVVKGQGQ